MPEPHTYVATTTDDLVTLTVTGEFYIRYLIDTGFPLVSNITNFEVISAPTLAAGKFIVKPKRQSV